jgi:polyphosphate kinase
LIGARRPAAISSTVFYLEPLGDFAVYPTVRYLSDTDWVERDLERRIQQLCAQVVATEDAEELNQLCAELQKALKDHIGGIRQRVKEFRSATKRRPAKRDDSKE